MRYYPAALPVFRKLLAPISLAFVGAYPTPQAAAQLSDADFAGFARRQRHYQPQHWPACDARLQAPQPAAAPATIAIYQAEAVALACKQQALRSLEGCFAQHPDAAIFRSLPGTGAILARACLVR